MSVQVVAAAMISRQCAPGVQMPAWLIAARRRGIRGGDVATRAVAPCIMFGLGIRHLQLQLLREHTLAPRVCDARQNPRIIGYAFQLAVDYHI
jgi:hypothetical protein